MLYSQVGISEWVFDIQLGSDSLHFFLLHAGQKGEKPLAL
jgi:hypothetical protein